MTKAFFCIKQGSRLPLGSPQARQVNSDLVSSPCFFLSTPKGASIDINPAYKDVPFLQEKLKILKQYIKADRATVVMWERSEPTYPLLPKIKDRLEVNLKILTDITGDQPCP